MNMNGDPTPAGAEGNPTVWYPVPAYPPSGRPGWVATFFNVNCPHARPRKAQKNDLLGHNGPSHKTLGQRPIEAYRP